MDDQNQEILKAIPKACSDELKAVELIEQLRWGGNPACPRCGDLKVTQLKDRRTKERNKRFLWNCQGCKQQFTVRIGTIMEDSRIAYRHWCLAYWMASTSKKGVSALQISRMTQLSYKSALFLMHRIRAAMVDDSFSPKMDGIVEVDEVYLGGKERNKHANKKLHAGPLGGKTPVVALLQRDGKVRTTIMHSVNRRNLRRFLYTNVDHSARVFTDTSVVYSKLSKVFPKHEQVNHYIGQYVKGDVTTNTVEGFFGLIRRGMKGVFHSVSLKHLPRYLRGFEFMYETRKLGDGLRLSALVRGSDGKRLKYRDLVAAQ